MTTTAPRFAGGQASAPGAGRRTPARSRLLALVAATASALLLSVGFVSTAAQAVLVTVPSTGAPGLLSLRSDPYPAQFLDLSPGEWRHWQIAADIVDPYSPLTLQVERHGELIEHPHGLMMRVLGCDQPWAGFPSAPTCATAQTVIASQPASSGALGVIGPATLSTPAFTAGDVWAGQSRYLLVSLWIDDTPAARADTTLMGIDAEIGFGITARGGVEPPGSLPVTGADPLALLLLGLGAIGLGLSAALYARARKEQQS